MWVASWKLLREYRLKQKRDAQREKEAAAAAAKSERKRTSSAAEARSAKLEKLRIKRTQSAAKVCRRSARAMPRPSRPVLTKEDPRFIPWVVTPGGRDAVGGRQAGAEPFHAV